MKMLVIVVLAVLAAATADDDKYSTKFDDVDVDQILKNERLVKSYFNCLVEKGPCSPEGKELKKNVPDALENDCAKCSDKQRINADKILSYLFKHKQDSMFEELEAKYDTEHKYRARIEKKLAAGEAKQ